MTVYATNGAKLFIGGTEDQKSANFVLSDFADHSSSWVEVKEVESLGALGDTAEQIDFTAVGDARTRMFKGARTAGVMEVVCGIDPDDDGQLALIAAEKTIHDYAFKLVFNDAPPGGDPSERYFIAKVMSQTEQLDAANNIMKLNVSLAVNSNVVRVAAAA